MAPTAGEGSSEPALAIGSDGASPSQNCPEPFRGASSQCKCAACIGVDASATVEERELLRALSDCLGCPMPPPLAP